MSDGTLPFIAVVPIGPQRWRFRVMRSILRVGGWIPSFRLARLPIVHFAEWGLLRRYRGRVGLPGRPEHSLVFVSVFDGDVDEYIITLWSLIPRRFAQAFGQCTGYPRGRSPAALLRYISRYEHPTAYFYRRYPGTVRDGRAATALATGLDQVATGAVPDADERLAGLARLHDIGPVVVPPPGPLAVVRATLFGPTTRGSFTTLAAVRPDVDRHDLLDRLRSLDPQLFDVVPGTHYARFALIEHFHDRHDRLMTDAPAFLLFSAQHDLDPDEREGYPVRLASALARHPHLADALLPLWGSCEDTDDVIGRDGARRPVEPAGLVDLLLVGAVDTGLFLSGTVAGRADDLAAATGLVDELDSFLDGNGDRDGSGRGDGGSRGGRNGARAAFVAEPARRRRGGPSRPTSVADLRAFLDARRSTEARP